MSKSVTILRTNSDLPAHENLPRREVEVIGQRVERRLQYISICFESTILPVWLKVWLPWLGVLKWREMLRFRCRVIVVVGVVEATVADFTRGRNVSGWLMNFERSLGRYLCVLAKAKVKPRLQDLQVYHDATCMISSYFASTSAHHAI